MKVLEMAVPRLPMVLLAIRTTEENSILWVTARRRI